MLKQNVLEIETTLFTSCNLKCDFCFENISGSRTIDIDYIKSIPDKVTDVCIPILKERPECHHFRHALWGGELFYDTIPDSMLELYDWVISEIGKRVHTVRPDVHYETSYISNGVFTKRKRIFDLIKKHNSEISLSYDPIGRFATDEQKSIWYQSYQYFNKRMPEVIVTLALSKRNIKAYMNGDKYFEKIQWFGKFDPNPYEAGENEKDDEDAPSNQDYLDFFIWCLKTKHYSLIDGGYNLNLFRGNRIDRSDFNISCVPFRFSKWIEKTFNMTCVPVCMETLPNLSREIVRGGYKYLRDANIPIDLCPKVLLVGHDRGCYACKYFRQCELLPCPSMQKDRTITDCFNRRFYAYTDKHPELMKGYWEWREQYHEMLNKKKKKLKLQS